MRHAWLLLPSMLLVACPNGDGKVLGPIPGAPATNVCAVPCKTAADCPKPLPPNRVNQTYVWLCEDEHCVDVDCVVDKDCTTSHPNATFPGYGKCVEKQCAYDCRAGGTCNDDRDTCVKGKCMRFAEVNPPRCKSDADCREGFQLCYFKPCTCGADGVCRQRGCDKPARNCGSLFAAISTCFSDQDCPEWMACRLGVCRPYLVDSDASGWGRPCDSDQVCQGKHLAQTILNTSQVNDVLLGSRYYFFDEACGDLCDATLGGCGPGLSCVDVPSGHSYPEWALDQGNLRRSICLPDECAAASGCRHSLKPCASSAECTAPESCAWPVSPCPGVCMDLTCASCASWLQTHTRHVCTKVGGSNVNTEIIRPD